MSVWTVMMQAIIIGMILAVPLIVLIGVVKLLIKVMAQSKLSLDDYVLVVRDGLPPRGETDGH